MSPKVKVSNMHCIKLCNINNAKVHKVKSYKASTIFKCMSCFEGIRNKISQLCKYLETKKIQIIVEEYKRIILIINVLN